MNQEMDFRFEVSFGEPQVGQSEPLIETLSQAADQVDILIRDFEPLV